ncbi:MAG: DNA-formamidopyrimidine glycosylase [Candidatus Lokiarchaeota archaeon]|nr:DNA-formamidopyrimidine glycosylase [Candidatus Lokiarchaeota archaeon]
MPELPEVETYRRYFESTSLNQKIINLKIRDDRILNLKEKALKNSIIGNSFHSTHRHGKNLFIKFEKKYLMLHFGMSGDLLYFTKEREEPKHSRVLFIFENHNFLSYISQRLFGKVDIVSDIDNYIKKKELGPDAYKMSYKDFKDALQKRSAYAKTLLMNQSFVAGIGNIYSDEILFQANIHPKTKINSLDKKNLDMLFKSIKAVLKTGIEKKGNLDKFPKNYLIPYRQREEQCPECNTEIKRYEISGRHGFFCPHCQIK